MAVVPVTGFELAATGTVVRDPAGPADAGRPNPPPADWIPAVVPGGVHESLLAAERIPHPYGPDGEARVRWVEETTWWYRARFAAPPEASGADRVRLVCHGLDTVATVWLNGSPLGGHRSQFRPAVFDVTGKLGDDNELLIRFDPPLAGVAAPAGPAESLRRMREEFAAALPAMLPAGTDPASVRPPGVMAVDPAMTRVRKAAYSWGWDFAPRVPSVGVSGPVQLRVARGAELTGCHVRTLRAEPDGPATGSAEVALTVTADAFAHPAPLTARVTLTGPDGTRVGCTLPLPVSNGRGGERTATATVRLDHAYLWWTHDLGSPHRYTVRTELYDADGARLDAREDVTGLRTVELDRSTDGAEGGRAFRFVLNGVPIFARGANWVPPDMLTGAVTAETYRTLVNMAVRANMNMLRVWGGGVYPAEEFFAACDAAGVLVWQDFMFACVDYPDDDPELRTEVAAEAEYQVRRLRGHPCLALWCGNNEVQEIHAGLRGGLDGDGWGRSFFDELLPSVVARLSPEIPYWPGSPWGEDDPAGVGGVRDGDRHAWEVWHGQDKGAGGPASFPSRGAAVHFSRYGYDLGKFVSEFGIHSCPEPGTLTRWAGRAPELHDAEFDRRIKDAPVTKGDDLLAYETGVPGDLAAYADFSMAAQAEGMKFGIEHYRRRRPHCSGALVWQFNDAWPGMSWSVLDYDRIGKAAYYFVQRAFRPVLASFAWSADDGLTLWLTNDLRTGVHVRLRAQVTTFARETVLDEEVTAVAAAGSSAPVWSAPAERVGAGPDRYAWVAPVGDNGAGPVGANRLFFAPLKRLRLPPSRVTTRVLSSTAGHAELELTASGYVYMGRVAAPGPGVTFSANHLDLRDGDRVRISVSGLPPDFDPSLLRATTYAGAPIASPH